jgi:hypothetical protein
MKSLVCLILFPLFVVAGQLMVGGSIPLINHVECSGNVCLDLSSPSTNVDIATLVMSNNSGKWKLTIHFQNRGKLVNKQGSSITPTQLVITEGGSGILGRSVTPLINKDLLYLNGTDFVWESTQQSATLNYLMLIKASWNSANMLAGFYEETITAIITAEE